MKPVSKDSSPIADKTAQPATGIANPITWEERLQALQVISPCATVKMRKPGDWYVSAGMEHASGECCLVSDYGNGTTPEEAVDAHWALYGNGEPFNVISANAYQGAWYRWNGFMWAPSSDPRK